MARLSNSQRIPERFTPDPALMTRNAEASGGQVDYRKTRIGMTQGARESSPYGRDDASLVDAREDRRQRLHNTLDRLIDGAEPEEHDDNEEPQEEWSDADEPSLSEIQKSADAFLKAVDPPKKKVAAAARDRRVAHDSGYICDSDFIAKYIHPDKFCVQVENELRPQVVAAQADNAMRGYWAGLFEFLRSQPEGFRIRDISNKACLSTLISKTLAA
jgi:hypothetical protein